MRKIIFSVNKTIDCFASSLTCLGLVDEFWFVTQPIILGNGNSLFKNLTERIDLKLVETKTFDSGVVAMHYLK